MLINGVILYGRTFECETSHRPTPTPLQCPRCFQCTNKAILVTDGTPFLPVKIIDPPTAIAEPTDSDSDLENDTTITIIKSLITFMTKTLFDLFPMQRSKIQTILENTSNSVFNVVIKVSHTGHKIHSLSTSEVVPTYPPPPSFQLSWINGSDTNRMLKYLRHKS
jgi:hypothetical protein